MAVLAPSAPSNAQTNFAEPRPSGWGTASRVLPSVAEALDRSDLPRMRVFHIFGICAPLAAMMMSFALGGDAAARLAFCIGAAVLALANVGLVYLSGSAERWQPTPIGI